MVQSGGDLIMLLMTSERCPIDNQIVYMRLLPKDMDNDLIIADGCYLDNEGILCIAMFDENTVQPDYICIHCGWIA
tara:strand:+ start:600 stop:827 length:228 start_codon:yes stop_codon:yes gene_type:complete